MDFSWWPDWKGHACIIVASGPSAKTVNLEFARGNARLIAVNSSWRLCPWADVLYACDFSWWHYNKGVPDFKGLKVSQHARVPKNYPEIKLVQTVRSHDRGGHIQTERGKIGWGPSSGFQAVNLAIQFGTKHIILVGFDMRLDLGLHWHGPHETSRVVGKKREQTGLHNPHMGQVARWRKILDDAKPSIDALGVRVINASPVSALKTYPKMTLEEALR